MTFQLIVVGSTPFTRMSFTISATGWRPMMPLRRAPEEFGASRKTQFLRKVCVMIDQLDPALNRVVRISVQSRMIKMEQFRLLGMNLKVTEFAQLG